MLGKGQNVWVVEKETPMKELFGFGEGGGLKLLCVRMTFEEFG